MLPAQDWIDQIDELFEGNSNWNTADDIGGSKQGFTKVWYISLGASFVGLSTTIVICVFCCFCAKKLKTSVERQDDHYRSMVSYQNRDL